MNNQNPSQDFGQNNQGGFPPQDFGQNQSTGFNSQPPQQDFNQNQNTGFNSQTPQQDFNQGGDNVQAPNQGAQNQEDFSNPFAGFDTAHVNSVDNRPQEDAASPFGSQQDVPQNTGFNSQTPQQDFNQNQNTGFVPQMENQPQQNFNQPQQDFSNPFGGADNSQAPNMQENNFQQPNVPVNPQGGAEMNTGFDPNVFQDEEVEEPKKNKSLLLVLVFLIVLAIAAGGYLYFFVLNGPSNTPETVPVTSITTTTKSPKPFLNLNSAVTSEMQISLHNSDLVKNHIQEKALENLEEAGTIKIIEPTVKSQYLNNLEVLTSLVDSVPESLLQSLNEQYILYTYYGEERPTLGLILSLKSGSTESVAALMQDWEDSETLLKDTSNLWLFTNKTTKEKVFKNTDVSGAVARCFGFTEKEADLCYLVHNDHFIITTSLVSLNKAYTSLFGESAAVQTAPVETETVTTEAVTQ